MMFVDVDATRYGELIHPHEFVEVESNEITSVLHPMYVINSFSFHCSLFIIHCSWNRYLPQRTPASSLKGTLLYPRRHPHLSNPSHIVRMVEQLAHALHLHLPRTAGGVICANNEGEGKYLIIALLILEAMEWYEFEEMNAVMNSGYMKTIIISSNPHIENKLQAIFSSLPVINIHIVCENYIQH